MTRLEAVRSSALWAAWADALGFISEFAKTRADVSARIGDDTIREIRPWTKILGGRFGTPIPLPAGTYSDDTQCRLATSRAIRGDGRFDIDAYSRVELAVWPSYALGGGKASKAAARALATIHGRWNNNFYETESARYLDAGGNGAAMRIQPHVWSARSPQDPDRFLSGVVRNTLTTHGHPRAFVGAILHACMLGIAVAEQRLPGPSEWSLHLDALTRIPKILRDDDDLVLGWISYWESQSKMSLEAAFEAAIRELADMMQALATLPRTAASYEEGVNKLDLRNPKFRGAGDRCAVAAGLAAWIFEDNPSKGICTIANDLGTDTDTLATMAGALLGAATKSDPPDPPLDAALIASDAARLVAISEGRPAPTFVYPDPLHWRIPKSQLDFVGSHDDRVAIAGLGPGRATKDVRGRKDETWQWIHLDFGQHIIVRRRDRLQPLPSSLLPRGNRVVSKSGDARFEAPVSERNLASKPTSTSKPSPKATSGKTGRASKSLSVESAVRLIVESNFDPTRTGRLLLEVSITRGVEEAAALASIVAYELRRRKDSPGS